MCDDLCRKDFQGTPNSSRWVTTGFRFDNTEDFYWAKVGSLPGLATSPVEVGLSVQVIDE